MDSHSVDLIPPHPLTPPLTLQKKLLKTPILKPYDLTLLFCVTIRELWTLAASEL